MVNDRLSPCVFVCDRECVDDVFVNAPCVVELEPRNLAGIDK